MAELLARDLTVRFRASGQGSPTDEPGPRVEAGEVVALDHVDLQIPDGRTLALIGPSGCGKTTLIRALAGLVRPNAGSIWFGEREVTELPPRDRDVAVVFQEYALYPHMPSGGIVSFFFQMHRRRQEIPERIVRACEIMGPGFDELLDRKPGELSGGEQQRVAIARCIIRDPAMFLFDEPLANLDAGSRGKVRIETKRLLRRFGTTALYVTHDQREAAAIGDEIAVMVGGRIIQRGPFQNLRRYPANTLVAGFVGIPPMNLFPARVVEGSVRLGRSRVPVGRSRISILEGESVTVGVHADELEICAPEDALVWLEAESVQPRPEQRAVLATGQSHGRECSALLPIESGAIPGDVIPLRALADRWALFDPEDRLVP